MRVPDIKVTPPGPDPPAIRSNRSLTLRNSLLIAARPSGVLSEASSPTIAVYRL